MKKILDNIYNDFMNNNSITTSLNSDIPIIITKLYLNK